MNIKGLLVGVAASILCLMSTSQLYAASYQMHTICSGDTYSEIAYDNDVNLRELQKINNQSNGTLKIGSLVKVKQIKDINVNVNGEKVAFDAQPYIENNRIFIPIRFVSEALNCDSIDWNQEAMKATIKTGNKNIIVKVGSDNAVIDGQTVKIDAPVQLYEGRTFVPLRFFSETIGVDSIEWNSETYTVDIKKSGVKVDKENVTQSYSEEDLYYLSRIIEVEAGSQSLECKIGVANVIINRKKSTQFPNTIKDVVFDTKYGIQFPPAMSDKFNKTPSEESISAAVKALEGYNNVGESLYFSDSSIKSSWVTKNRKYYKAIGNQAFYL